MIRRSSRKGLGRGLVSMAALLSALAIPDLASARVQRDLDYRYEQVWGTLVRLLRVDYRYPVEEQDDAHGFVLFQYVEYGRRHTASVELVRIADADTRTRLVVQVEGVPQHLEAQIVEDLERKLRVEIGRPQQRPQVVAQEGDARAPNRTPSTVPRLRERPEGDGRVHGERASSGQSAADRDAGVPGPDASTENESRPRARRE